jgi:hypothetical protein
MTPFIFFKAVVPEILPAFVKVPILLLDMLKPTAPVVLLVTLLVNEVTVRWEAVRPVVEGRLVMLPVIEKLDGGVVVQL